MGHRNLARTETIDANAVLGIGQTLVQLRFHVLSRDDYLQFALQPFSERFDYLHVHTFISWRPCPASRLFGEHDAGRSSPCVASLKEFACILPDAKWRPK